MAPRLPALLLVLGGSGCSFLLDFDELQGGAGSGGQSASSGGREAAGGSPDGTGGTEPSPSEGGQGGASEPGVPLEQAPAALANVLCDTLAGCVGTAAMSVIFWDEACKVSSERLIANTIVASVQRSEQEGALVYDGSALPTCLEEYSDLPCDQVTLGFPEECKRALSGLQDAGATCAHALECAAGLYCEPANCACSRPAEQGEQCLVTQQCAPGLACFMGACQPMGEAGEPCGGGVAPECLTGLICVTADEKAAMPGRCFPADELFIRYEGDDCNALGDPPTLCTEGLACPVGVLPKCVRISEPGGACQLAFPDMCPSGQYCSSGTCVDLPGPGQACARGLVLDRTCRAYSRCVNDICRLLGDNGNTCVSPSECWSGICRDGKCSPPYCE